MEEQLHFLRYPHVVPEVLTADVRRRDDTVTRQLPYVKLVDPHHALHLGDE